MTNASESAPATPPPARRGGGFFARLIAAFLVVLITTTITLLATGAMLLWLGFTPEMPSEMDLAKTNVALLSRENANLVNRTYALETAVADLSRRASDHREALGDIRSAIDDVRILREQVREQLTAIVAQNATLVADVRASRDQVNAFATAEAGRAALLQELDRRSQRIERFLQRLSDIAGDAALDLRGPTPLLPAALPAPTAVAEPTALPTPTTAPAPAPALTRTPEVTATDISAASPTVNPSPTPVSTVRSTPTAP
ncbi:MAG: hypothetical protein NZ699_09135 [Roseiflexus sp.]|nr:hypothetical protein [Roseiflexus sp.]MCS7289279.1 hypothetical protein [Roseiflexus sp.]MDW8232481.1 hypothetical protein [Roseiflexaceae bacterium]